MLHTDHRSGKGLVQGVKRQTLKPHRMMPGWPKILAATPRRWMSSSSNACSPDRTPALLGFLHHLKTAYDHNGETERAGLCCFQFYLIGSAHEPVQSGITVKTNASDVRKRETWHTYPEVRNFLLTTYGTDEVIADAYAVQVCHGDYRLDHKAHSSYPAQAHDHNGVGGSLSQPLGIFLQSCTITTHQ